MAWYHHLWPWCREKAEERRRIEAEFKEQLLAAYERRGDLADATRQLREDRERRQALQARPRRNSRPSL